MGYICLVIEPLPIKDGRYRKESKFLQLSLSSFFLLLLSRVTNRWGAFDVEVPIILFQVSSLNTFQLQSLGLILGVIKRRSESDIGITKVETSDLPYALPIVIMTILSSSWKISCKLSELYSNGSGHRTTPSSQSPIP